MPQKVLTQGDPNLPTIIIQQPSRRLLVGLLLMALAISVLVNLGFLATFVDYAVDSDAPTEKFRSGELLAEDKIARIAIDFTIMPPYSERIQKTIDYVRKDEDVKGVLLVIDSPGGLVSDSHEIYHKLQLLAQEKPMFVQMKGIAASGGYYVAMGAGPEAPIYAEPTTWTGSIGVIIPRYNATELGEKLGITADSLATGPLKDTLNPLKDLTEREREVWNAILEDSFQEFLTVIDESRKNLTMDQIRELATGQVYTADQALKNGLVDKISYEDDTLQLLVKQIGLSKYQVVDYKHPLSFVDTFLGVTAPNSEISLDPLKTLMESSTPRAFYLFGWPYGMDHK